MTKNDKAAAVMLVVFGVLSVAVAWWNWDAGRVLLAWFHVAIAIVCAVVLALVTT